MDTQFKITKSLLEGYCNKGLTVQEMAQELTTLAGGVKCSQGVVREAAKAYGIALKNKRRKPVFVFGDYDSTVSTIDRTVANEEGEGRTMTL